MVFSYFSCNSSTLFGKFFTIFNLTFLSSLSLFYFSVGTFLALKNYNIILYIKKSSIFLPFMLGIGLNGISFYNFKEPYLSEGFLVSLDILIDLTGFLGICYIYDVFNTKRQWNKYRFYNYSFFIFAFHAIPTLILVKLSRAILPNNTLLLFISYLLIVPFIIGFSIFLGSLTEKLMHTIYAI